MSVQAPDAPVPESDRLTRLELYAACLTAEAAEAGASDSALVSAVAAQMALAEARLLKARLSAELILSRLREPSHASTVL